MTILNFDASHGLQVSPLHGLVFQSAALGTQHILKFFLLDRLPEALDVCCTGSTHQTSRSRLLFCLTRCHHSGCRPWTSWITRRIRLILRLQLRRPQISSLLTTTTPLLGTSTNTWCWRALLSMCIATTRSPWRNSSRRTQHSWSSALDLATQRRTRGSAAMPSSTLPGKSLFLASAWVCK